MTKCKLCGHNSYHSKKWGCCKVIESDIGEHDRCGCIGEKAKIWFTAFGKNEVIRELENKG
jgi:hypothetical protein